MEGRNEELAKLVKEYSKINPIRNKIAHASFEDYVRRQDRKEKLEHKDDINEVNRYYTQLHMILNSDGLKQLPKAISLKELKEVKC